MSGTLGRKRVEVEATARAAIRRELLSDSYDELFRLAQHAPDLLDCVHDHFSEARTLATGLRRVLARIREGSP